MIGSNTEMFDRFPRKSKSNGTKKKAHKADHDFREKRRHRHGE